MTALTGNQAWQPLTPPGVAAFAQASLLRLLIAQLVLAAVVAAVVAWCLAHAWFPVVTEAIRALPDRGEIRSGELAWSGDSPRLLAAGPFLAISVDLRHQAVIRSPAHLQVEFGERDVRFFSLFGFRDQAYPAAPWVVSFNRRELEPKWGAWQTPILWLAAVTTVCGLLAGWAVLAALWCGPVWLTAFFANRDLDLRRSWRLSAAALLPGALLMALGIVLYGAGALDLVQLIAVMIAQIFLGWIYALICVASVPRLPFVPPAGRNPFVDPADAPSEPQREPHS